MKPMWIGMIVGLVSWGWGVSAEPPPVDDAALGQSLAGVWAFQFDSGKTFTHRIFADQTWQPGLNEKAPPGAWHREDDKVILIFPDGGVEWLTLPINPTGTDGRARLSHARFTAIRDTASAPTGPEPAPDAVNRVASSITGQWTFYYASGTVFTHRFNADRTWHPGGTDEITCAWTVKGDYLVMTFPDGGIEWLFLPINPKETIGYGAKGEAFVAAAGPPKIQPYQRPPGPPSGFRIVE
jgi:hypothetical protein